MQMSQYPHRFPRIRLSLGVALATASALLVTACSGSAGGEAGRETNGQPVKGGSLVIGLQSDPSPLNPNLSTNGPSQQIGSMIYEPLAYFDNKAQEPKPVLASSWQTSEDGLTYTFDLVDATFTDGQKLTSADVKYTIEEVAAKTFAPFASAAAVIDEVDDSKQDQVVITLKRPFAPFLLSLTRVWILPKHVFEGTNPLTNRASIDKPVGTGPFKLGEFTRGSSWKLVRNEKYWQEGRPYLDSIVGKVVPDSQSATLALVGGEIQYISSQVIASSDVEQATAGGKAKAQPDSFAPNVTEMFFNTKREITGKQEVRKAIAMAIDRKYLLENVFQNGGKVAKTPFDSRLGYETTVDFDELYPYDPEKAGKALDAAGYPKKGKSRFSLTILVEGASRFQPVAEAIRSMLLKVGIDAKVSAPEASVTTEQAFKAPGKFDIYVQSYTTNWDPALGIERAYVTKSIGTPFGNASGYSSKKVDDLFAKGTTAVEEKERAIPYGEVQTVLADELPVFPLVETKLSDVAAANVHGLWYAANWGQWQEAWVG